MTFSRLTSRLVVGGATAALATAALVGATGTAAQAAPVSTTYSCVLPALGTQSVAVTVDVGIPASLTAGLPVPAGLLSFPSSITVPKAVVDALGGSANGAKSDNFSASFGDTVATAPVSWQTAVVPDNADGSRTYTGKGANAAFVLPKAGTYTVTMPKSFTLTPTNNGTALPFTGACTTTAPATIGTLTLTKQTATVQAKATPASVKKGGVVTVKGKVKNQYSKKGGPEVTGKVIIKDGKTKVGTGKIKKGKFVVKLKGLAVGSHTLTVSYKGDDYTDKGVSKELKVNVKA